MTPTPDQLRHLRTEPLFAAGRAVDALADSLADQVAALGGARRGTTDSWEGASAVLADVDLVRQRGCLEAARDELRALGSLLGQAAYELAQAQLHAEAHAAAAADLRLAAALTRSAAQARDGSGLDPRTAHAELLAATARAAELLPPAGSSPAQVRAWWQRLGADEQGALVRDQPQLVGRLDGVPCAARDQANRRLLDQLIDGEAAVGDERQVAGFLAVRARLQHSPDALLLDIGTEGQGRAVLAFGDPDTSANTCVYVPGMGTRLADAAGKDADRAVALRTAAGRLGIGGTASTATVVWLGYDPPLGVVDAMSSGRATRGAAAYDGFLLGLRATHLGAPPHLTALGHSYGSLLVGLAGRRQRPNPADDVVLIGSPGVGADHAAALGVAPGPVWVGAAPHDPVASLPSRAQVGLPLLSSLWPGTQMPLVQLLTHRTPEVWFGRDPADPGFGARRFTADDGSGSDFASAHSHYLDPGSRSLAAVARIVAGTAGAADG
jgi:hypothetical protein